MKKRTDKQRLQDILDATIRIESYLSATSEKRFAKDWLHQDAILRRIGIIGEAARNVSAKFQAQHSEMPWSQMIAAQNKIMDEHFKIDVPMLWETAKNDIPQLKKMVVKLLGEL